MEILLILLPALGALFLFLSGAFSEDDSTLSIFLALGGVLMLMMVGGLVSEAACEKALIECVNGEVVYDTVAVDKNGKLLEIKIKDK